MMTGKSMGWTKVAKAPAVSLAIAIAAQIVPGGAASAQADVQAQSVSERARPEFGAQPLRAGGLEILPSIEVRGGYEDNVLFVPQGAVDDFLLAVRPELTVRQSRSDRLLSLSLSSGYDTYLDNTISDRLSLRASSSARLGLGTSTRFRLGAIAERNDEARNEISSFSTGAKSIKYTSFVGNAGVDRDIGPFVAGVDVRARSVSYDGAILISNQTIDVGFRDFQSYAGTGRLAYSLGSSRRVYVQATYDNRDYASLAPNPLLPPAFAFDRSSTGMRVEAGFTQQFSELLFFDARVGYLKQDYDSPLLDDVSSLSFEGSLLWNASPLTTIELGALRSVDETVSPLLSGLVRTEFRAQVDHELLRNLILSANGRFAQLKPIGNLAAIDDWEIGASARYLLNAKWSLIAQTSRFERSGTTNISQSRASIGVRYNFF